MDQPPTPPDEQERLASLRSLHRLDTPAEERFDRITRLARKALGTPIALVSLVDEKRQWFKSRQGLEVEETSRLVSFCGHAIESDRILVVEDAREDARFHDNPLVTGPTGIRMYAGRPIKTPDGQLVGTLCVIDTEPRHLGEDDLVALDDLAGYVEVELRSEALGETEKRLRAELSEAERRASLDALTRLWNRGMIERVLAHELDRAARQALPISLMLVDLDHFKRINDTHGHPFGDAVLREVAARLRAALRPYDSPGRYGGEEFIAVLPECDAEDARAVAERVLSRFHDTPIDHGPTTVDVTASIGICSTRPSPDASVEALLAFADRLLYAAKAAGRDRVESGTCAT